MENLANELSDYLLEFQDKFSIGEANVKILWYGNTVFIKYITQCSNEMHVSIINSTAFPRRLGDINVCISMIHCDAKALTIEFKLNSVDLNNPIVTNAMPDKN